ncbi:hypothetical protein L7F22_010297 [Adiantum nelumboides]|nr:hypothetical protein [Adiantum nelumboides]
MASGSRCSSHQLSNGLYVSGHPEQYKERQPSFKSTAMPYTGGDIRKSGELGKMFDIQVEEPPKARQKLGYANPSPNSAPSSCAPTRPTSGPLTSSGLPRQNSASAGQNRSGPLTSGGRPASHSGPLSRSGGDLGNANRPSSGSNSQKNSGPLSASGAPSIVRQNSGSLLPVTGLITSGPVTSGPLNASGAPKKPFSGPLDLNGAPIQHKFSHHPINNIGLQALTVKRSFPTIILWTVVPLFLIGFVVGGFILVTVHNPILLMVVGTLCACMVLLLGWNFCWTDSSPMSFLAAYEDAHLSNAKDGQFVKVTGIVTCGSVPLDSSFQRVTRCVYSSTGLYEYRGLKSKPAKARHRRFTWALRYLERQVVDFYISDLLSGSRALVKAGYGAPVIPHVREVTLVDVSGKNKELPADFVRWMSNKNLSCDDRLMCLREGYIREGNTVTVMGVVQRQENVLMIVPPREPVSTGYQWRKLFFPRTLKGLIVACHKSGNVDAVTW